MNIGELNVTPKFFDSQTQLDNDWLVSKNETSSFENILEKTQERSDDVREPKQVETKKVNLSNKKFEKVERPTADPTDNQMDEVKAMIKEAIAQKKFSKENAVEGEVDLKDLEEKIKNLEEAIMEELGITEKPDVLEMISDLLNVDLEALVEQLSTEEGQTALLESLVAKMDSGELDKEEVVAILTEVMDEMPKADKASFEKVVTEFTEKLPETESKEVLKQFEEVLKEIVEQKDVPKAVVPKEAQAQTITQSQEKEVVKEPIIQDVTTDKPVEEVTTKSSTQQEQTTSKDSEPLMNAEVKTANKEGGQKFSLEDQINVMKAEGNTIVSSKETPKAILSRSVMNQVVQGTKMSINMSDQGSEILIKLNPKNLGNVALKMQFDKGTLLAQIQVENQTVKGIIESNLDDLKSALRDEGYEIGNLDVSVNKESSGEQQQQSFTGGKKQFVNHETFEEIEEKIMKQRANDEGIDYLA